MGYHAVGDRSKIRAAKRPTAIPRKKEIFEQLREKGQNFLGIEKPGLSACV